MRLVREDIAAIESWASNNLLTLNSNKTKAMLMGSARFIISFPHSSIQLHLNGDPNELTNKVTNLGISMNNNLNWAD